MKNCKTFFLQLQDAAIDYSLPTSHERNGTGLQYELEREQMHRNACVQNWLGTNRPSFAAANQAVTLTRVTSERAVLLGRLSTGHLCSLVQLLPTKLKLVVYNTAVLSRYLYSAHRYSRNAVK